MITVRGKPMDWHEGLTVEEALKRIGYAVPSALVLLDKKVSASAGIRRHTAPRWVGD